MNEISVKIVESPKDVLVESAPPTENVVNDEDPLAIDEESGRVNEAETPVAEKAGTCDENAKDESEFGTQIENSVKSITLQSEKINGEFEYLIFIFICFVCLKWCVQNTKYTKKNVIVWFPVALCAGVQV